MKLLYIFFFITIFSCEAQKSKCFISETPIHNISTTPVYKMITDTVDNKIVWADEYKYIDSIDMSWITYLSDGLKIRGLLVKPKKPGNYPCVIFNRGGNRNTGSLTVYNAVETMGKLAKEGYVVIGSQYRGNGGSEGHEEFGGKDINDVLILPEVLAEIESADTSRIGLYGWSRGGMMTYLALSKSTQFKVAVVGGGESDLTTINRPKMEKFVYQELIPNYEKNKDSELKKRSAIHFVDQFPKDVPILMLHGNADWRVRSEKALQLALEFEKYRIPYRLKIFEGGNHGLTKFRKEKDKEVLNWFNTYLKNERPIPNMSFKRK